MLSKYELFRLKLKQAEIDTLITMMFVDISVVYVKNMIYAAVNISDEKAPDELLWIKIPDDVLERYLGKEKSKILLEKSKERNDEIVIFKDGYF